MWLAINKLDLVEEKKNCDRIEPLQKNISGSYFLLPTNFHELTMQSNLISTEALLLASKHQTPIMNPRFHLHQSFVLSSDY